MLIIACYVVAYDIYGSNISHVRLWTHYTYDEVYRRLMNPLSANIAVSLVIVLFNTTEA